MGATSVMVNSQRENKRMNSFIDRPLFEGSLVRLKAVEPGLAAENIARWMQDSEFVRLLDADPARLLSVDKHKELLEKDLVDEEESHEMLFQIQTLKDDLPIGLIGLDGIRWTHGDAWMGIGLGERDYWGKGHGSDAIRVMLDYAFNELNLHRVSLSVFAYNQRAINSYHKVGFIEEGRARQFLNRDGQRYDLLFMGILRAEWEGEKGI
jgi:RimJ/RimL family protein N-acetyltransferase